MQLSPLLVLPSSHSSADGRQLLYVISDNDLYVGRPTQIYAFAIDSAAAGVRYQRQQVAGPMFPPGLLKKVK